MFFPRSLVRSMWTLLGAMTVVCILFPAHLQHPWIGWMVGAASFLPAVFLACKLAWRIDEEEESDKWFFIPAIIAVILLVIMIPSASRTPTSSYWPLGLLAGAGMGIAALFKIALMRFNMAMKAKEEANQSSQPTSLTRRG